MPIAILLKYHTFLALFQHISSYNRLHLLVQYYIVNFEHLQALAKPKQLYLDLRYRRNQNYLQHHAIGEQ